MKYPFCFRTSPVLARTTFYVPSSMRNMSSAAIAIPKHEWIVILPDHEGVLRRRMKVRP